MISNLFFTSSDGIAPDDLKKKFMDACKQNGNKWCLIVRAMDNPVLGVREQDDLSDIVMGAASGAATGDRLPLLVYRVNVADGRESLIRGARLAGLTLRAMRNISADRKRCHGIRFHAEPAGRLCRNSTRGVRFGGLRRSCHRRGTVAAAGRRRSPRRPRRAGTSAAGTSASDQLASCVRGFRQHSDSSLCGFVSVQCGKIPWNLQKAHSEESLLAAEKRKRRKLQSVRAGPCRDEPQHESCRSDFGLGLPFLFKPKRKSTD